MKQELIAVFSSTHVTLKAEKVFRDAGIDHRTVMKPRKISSECGLAIQLSLENIDGARRAVSEAGCIPVRFFRGSAGSWDRLFELEDDGHF